MTDDDEGRDYLRRSWTMCSGSRKGRRSMASGWSGSRRRKPTTGGCWPTTGGANSAGYLVESTERPLKRGAGRW